MADFTEDIELQEAISVISSLSTEPEFDGLSDRARGMVERLVSFLRDPRGWPEIRVGASSPAHSPIDRYRCVSEECPSGYSVWEFRPDDYDLDESAVVCPACGAEGELFFRWFRGGQR